MFALQEYGIYDSAARHATASLREQILHWLFVNTGRRALVGGNLNTSVFSLEAQLGVAWDCYFQPEHKHGDVSLGKRLRAESVPCDIMSTSGEHRMCLVHVTMEEQRWTRVVHIPSYFASSDGLVRITCLSLSGAEIGCLEFTIEEQEQGATMLREKIANLLDDSDAFLEIILPSGNRLLESCTLESPLCEILS